MPLRLSPLLVLVLTLAVGAATAEGAAPLQNTPLSVHRGDNATFRVPASKAGSCSLSIRYETHALQSPGRRAPRNHAVSWVVRVPMTAPLGPARWTVVCGKSKQAGGFIVLDARTTAPGPGAEVPKIVIDKQGYTQRPDKYGPGSLISYGLMLRNASTAQDVSSVYVLVNMVDASGALLGSASRTVGIVGAGETFAFGDSLNLRTQTQVVRLEITIRISAHAPKKPRPLPTFANLRLVPDVYDPGWVGEVDGEAVNGTEGKTLASAQLSIVVFDASGNVIGGGTGSTTATVPSGARIVFLARSGFTAVPLDKAASVVVSSEPNYTNGS